jgi:hypothetical protein
MIDENEHVRSSVARNHKTSAEESYVKCNVTRNPSAPIDLVLKLSNGVEADSDHKNFTQPSIPIDLKAAILVDFTNWSINNPRYQDFFRYNDLGIPVALALTADLVIPKPSGTNILSETYILMCAELGIDKNKTFENFEEILDEVMYSLS